MYLKDYSPALKYGAKIRPQDLAGMIGLPYVGDVYYIDPTNGADTHGGMSQDDAFKTLSAALTAVTDNHHDVIVIVPAGTGTGTGITETAAITWSKNLVHLVGNVTSGPIASRARIGCSTNAISPFITMTGSGNSIHNVQINSNGATDYICFELNGAARNYFENCQIGVQNATAAANSACYDLYLYNASDENYFNNCVIGYDTFNRAAGSNVALALHCARNIFYHCTLAMFASAAAPFFIQTNGHQPLYNDVTFDSCIFKNAVGAGATAITAATSLSTDDPSGDVLLINPFMVNGANVAWGTVATIYANGISSNGTYAQGIGVSVHPTT